MISVFAMAIDQSDQRELRVDEVRCERAKRRGRGNGEDAMLDSEFGIWLYSRAGRPGRNGPLFGRVVAKPTVELQTGVTRS